MVVWGDDPVPARMFVASAALPHQNFAEFLMFFMRLKAYPASITEATMRTTIPRRELVEGRESI